MSTLYKCDFCGSITDNITAEVFFRYKNSVRSTDYQRVINETIMEREAADSEAAKKDCCEKCVDKFIGNTSTIHILTDQFGLE